MRIHGEKIIKRRNLDPRSDYHMYLPELREDFHYMCGYCGKTEKITKNAFEIDHFIPRKYAEDRKMIIIIWFIHATSVIGRNLQSGCLRIVMFSL